MQRRVPFGSFLAGVEQYVHTVPTLDDALASVSDPD
jgi:hypothetical protein